MEEARFLEHRTFYSLSRRRSAGFGQVEAGVELARGQEMGDGKEDKDLAPVPNQVRLFQKIKPISIHIIFRQINTITKAYTCACIYHYI